MCGPTNARRFGAGERAKGRIRNDNSSIQGNAGKRFEDSPPRKGNAQRRFPTAHTATAQLSLEEGVNPEIEAMVLSRPKEVVSRVWVAVVAVVVLVQSVQQEVLRVLLAMWVVRPPANVLRCPHRGLDKDKDKDKDKENVHSNRQRHKESRNLQSKMRKERQRSSPQKRARDLSQKQWHKKNRPEEDCGVSPYIYHLVTRGENPPRNPKNNRNVYNQAARGKGQRGNELAPLKNNGAASEAELRLLKQKIMSNNDNHPPKAKSADELIQSLSQRRLREEAQQEALHKAHLEAEANKVDSPTKKYQVTPDFVDPRRLEEANSRVKRSVETV